MLREWPTKKLPISVKNENCNGEYCQTRKTNKQTNIAGGLQAREKGTKNNTHRHIKVAKRENQDSVEYEFMKNKRSYEVRNIIATNRSEQCQRSTSKMITGK